MHFQNVLVNLTRKFVPITWWFGIRGVYCIGVVLYFVRRLLGQDNKIWAFFQLTTCFFRLKFHRVITLYVANSCLLWWLKFASWKLKKIWALCRPRQRMWPIGNGNVLPVDSTTIFHGNFCVCSFMIFGTGNNENFCGFAPYGFSWGALELFRGW